MLRALLNWAVEDDRLKVNPVAQMKAEVVVGAAKVIRDRVLSDDEIRAIWAATDELGQPFGFSVRMLFYTGLRLTEANDLRWSEVNATERLFAIPKSRMKAGNAFEVAYGDDVAALLDAMPRFVAGDYVFSMTGRAPYRGFAKGKDRLDKLSGVTGWKLHDIRRTCRTRWSGISQVSDQIKELCLDHAQPGLHRVYDQHKYRDEKRQLLTLWQQQLRNIIDPPAGNIVAMRAA
jgi:integrase